LGFDKREELGKQHFIGLHLETEGLTQTQVGDQLRV
jgi:hypothetical protein